MENQIEIIAKDLYTTYCAAVGGKAFNGDALPDWDTFKKDTKKQTQVIAWLATAERAIKVFNIKHEFWGAGEPDCPKDIKAANGNLHTLQCKWCGARNPRNPVCLTPIR